MHKITPCTKKKKKLFEDAFFHSVGQGKQLCCVTVFLQLSDAANQWKSDWWHNWNCGFLAHKWVPTFLPWCYMNVGTREAVHTERDCTPKAQWALSTISEQSAWHWWIGARLIWNWRWCLGNWVRGREGKMECSEAVRDDCSRRPGRGIEWLWNGVLELWGSGPCRDLARRIIIYPEHWVTCWQCV